MPQKACERYIFHVMAYAFFLNAQKSKNFIFGSFSVFKSITCFLKCPKIEESYFRFLFCLKIDHVLFLKCPIFPI